jgi:hypothetical protein
VVHYVAEFVQLAPRRQRRLIEGRLYGFPQHFRFVEDPSQILQALPERAGRVRR